MAVLPTASESPLLYACELWVFAMCPALRGSTVSYAGDTHFPKHILQYSLNFWSQSKKKTKTGSTSSVTLTLTLGLTLDPRAKPIKTEYWDRAGGEGNIGYEW